MKPLSKTVIVPLLLTIASVTWAACGSETPAEPATAPSVSVTATPEILPTAERAVAETATAAPLPAATPLPIATLKATVTTVPVPSSSLLPPAPTRIPTEGAVDDSEAECISPVAGESIGPVEDVVNERWSGPAPDTYALKVQIETTALWTSVEVTGVESITSMYAITGGDGKINVNVEGIKVHEVSRPEGRDYQQKIVVEIDAIVQKEDDTAVFQIRKERSGTTIYKLFSGKGDSTEEIARFTNGGTDDGDNLKTFLLDLDTLPSPIRFPTAEQQYKGPLFDAHVHLVGSKDHDHTGRPGTAQYERLNLNPESAESFFATLDKENIIGLIGFLKVIHEYFDGDDSYNRSYQEQTLSVVNRCDNKLIPFLHPYTHIGVTPKEHGPNLPKLIDQNYNGNPIPFRGIGEIHTGGILTDSYADMRLVDPAMLELFDYAAANDLIIMIHPELSHLEDLRRAINHNPSTVLLLHGLVNTMERGEIAEELATLFREHQNVYFSVDAALMEGYSLLNLEIRNKEQFLANLQSKGTYYRILASALEFWKPIIEAHPTRMMWGSDLLYWWHYEPDVVHEIAQYGRDFISGLDPEVQERFAYKNAVEMLGLSLNRGDR